MVGGLFGLPDDCFFDYIVYHKYQQKLKNLYEKKYG